VCVCVCVCVCVLVRMHVHLFHVIWQFISLIFIIVIIISFMELGHLLTRSCLTYPEVSSKVYHDSFFPLILLQ